jgi:hypothetical protein
VKKSDPTGWQGSAPPSLLQQRMEIDRIRTHGLFGVWGGAVLLTIWLVQLVISGFDALYLIQVVLAGAIICMGLRQIVRHKRTIAAFKTEHGELAGTQNPIH